jgi:beta-lactamase class C
VLLSPPATDYWHTLMESVLFSAKYKNNRQTLVKYTVITTALLLLAQVTIYGQSDYGQSDGLSGSQVDSEESHISLLSHGSGTIQRNLPALVRPELPEMQRSYSAYTTWLKQQVDETALPGVALAVVSSKGILLLETWGVRSAGKADLIDSNTIFRIASVSKTFAGTVAAQLVEQEAYGWDEPLIKILPQHKLGSDASSQVLTLRHIMSHSSGLMPHAYSNMLDAGVSYQKIQEKFHEILVVCAPGRCYGYQNVVFSLVADVVEVRTHKTYEQFVKDNIFTPLGMNTASLSLEDYLSNSNASSPHQRSRGSWQVASTNSAYYTTGPASGVNASILDMSRWAQANLGAFPGVLSRSLLDVQHTPVVETPRGSYFNRWPKVQNAWYGLGWRVFDYAGMRIVHHGGGVRGFRTELVLIPEKDLALVVLFNAETTIANDVVPGFLDHVIQQAALGL